MSRLRAVCFLLPSRSSSRYSCYLPPHPLRSWLIAAAPRANLHAAQRRQRRPSQCVSRLLGVSRASQYHNYLSGWMSYERHFTAAHTHTHTHTQSSAHPAGSHLLIPYSGHARGPRLSCSCCLRIARVSLLHTAAHCPQLGTHSDPGSSLCRVSCQLERQGN